MGISQSLLHEVAGSTIARGIVVRVEATRVTVVSGEDDPWEMDCEVLQLGEGRPLRLAPGDAVLAWRATDDAHAGVVLGRLGRSQAADCPHLPDEVVLEAGHSLTLRVGDGSITIREDGKILIKGKDLVSHATRTNRIKGGAVQIN